MFENKLSMLSKDSTVEDLRRVIYILKAEAEDSYARYQYDDQGLNEEKYHALMYKLSFFESILDTLEKEWNLDRALDMIERL